jgi:photosystem II stability/assembly factor-like uncharacterized protein
MVARSSSLAFVSAGALVLGLVVAGEARANGRFPASSAVVFSPADGARVMVRTTFGLLVTRDGGESWGWICERAIGFSGPEDPSYVVTKSGAIVAGLFDGLRVSRDGGCTWSAVKTDGSVFVDVTSRADGAIVALASSYDRHGDGGSLYKTQLWISTDDARSFTALGPRFDEALLGETVEVAASDPARLYVSAVRGDGAGRTGSVLVSTDGGKTWTERRSMLAPNELAPFIAAVDPKRADRIYIRTSAAPESPTRLVMSDDAGKTYRTLLAAKGPLLGFALSPDGASVSAGGPDDGLYAGPADAPALVQVSGPKLRIQCLGQRGDVLWACSSEAGGFVAGTSPNGGTSFDARLHLRDITGPIACAEGSSVAKECGVDWLKLKGELGVGAEEPARRAAGSDAGVAPPGEAARTRDRGVLWAAIVAAIGASALLLRARSRKR